MKNLTEKDRKQTEGEEVKLTVFIQYTLTFKNTEKICNGKKVQLPHKLELEKHFLFEKMQLKYFQHRSFSHISGFSYRGVSI